MQFLTPGQIDITTHCNKKHAWSTSATMQIFIASGVAASKVVIVPEGVNTTLFAPANFQPMDMPQVGKEKLRRQWKTTPHIN
jgi:hypothetical protein